MKERGRERYLLALYAPRISIQRSRKGGSMLTKKARVGEVIFIVGRGSKWKIYGGWWMEALQIKPLNACAPRARE